MSRDTSLFLIKQKRERRRYSVRVHIPGTPFIVAAMVNIDEFFLPTQKKIKKASQEIIGQGQRLLRKQEKAIDRQVRIGSLIAGLALWFVGGSGGPLVCRGHFPALAAPG